MSTKSTSTSFLTNIKMLKDSLLHYHIEFINFDLLFRFFNKPKDNN